MKTASVRTAPVLLVIAGVYVSQSLVTGVAMQGLPALLRAGGASLQQLGMVSLLMLPWAFKFLWAPWLERYRLPSQSGQATRSRRLIVVGQLLLAALFVGMAGTTSPLAAGTAAVLPLLGLMLLAALIAATTDIACDGFAVDRLPPGARGWANVMQVGGSYVGLVLGSGLFLLISAQVGWSVAWLTLAVIIVGLTLPWMRVRETAVTTASTATAAPRPSLRQAWQRPAVRAGVLLTVLLALGPRLALGLIGPRLLDHGVSLSMLGYLNGAGGVAAGIGGALLGGLLVKRYGAWGALRIALAVQLLALLGLAWAPVSVAALMALALLFSLALSGAFVASYTLLMHCAAGSQAGVDFTLFQCVDALVAVVLGMAGGWLAQQAGYSACFALAATATAAALLISYLKFTFILNIAGETV
jgi:MFS transporter (putative signal transducer)